LKAPFGEERQFIAASTTPYMHRSTSAGVYFVIRPRREFFVLMRVLDFCQRWRSLGGFG